MSPPKSTGFKPCRECRIQISATDPHLVCLWYLGSDHDSNTCGECALIHMKVIRERKAKLFIAKHQKTPQRWKSRGRSRSHF